MGHTFNRPDEAAMLRILERHPHSPEGAILRLAWLEGLSRSEITELRWDQVDFEGKAIQLPDRGELVLTGRHYTLPEQEK